MNNSATLALTWAATVPNPGTGGKTAPPGADKFLTVLQWAAYFGIAVCVLGIIVAGGGMALAASGRSNGGGEHMAKLGWTMAGAITIGAASAIVTALV